MPRTDTSRDVPVAGMNAEGARFYRRFCSRPSVTYGADTPLPERGARNHALFRSQSIDFQGA